MSENKPKSPEVKALENEVVGLKESIEKLSAYPELLETEKVLREKSEKELEKAQALIDKITKWAAEFQRFADSDYKGEFIYEEIQKLTQEKQTDSDIKL